MNNNIDLEKYFYEKIKKSFQTQKLLKGLDEFRLMKYYTLNKKNINSNYKQTFEEYILKADLEKNLRKRKEIIILGILIITLSTTCVIFLNMTLNIIYLMLLLLLFLFFTPLFCIKLIFFFNSKKKEWNKNF